MSNRVVLVLVLMLLLAATTASAADWAYRIQPARPDLMTKPTADELAAVGAHWEHLKELFRKGTVVFAGRTTKAEGEVFGVVVFHAENEEAARAIMNSDPAVQKGVMKATLFPFSIALMEGRELKE
ncbi:MAG TPA: YciI family protein [Thermoanaerobaculia bacterium]|nr:YciI family protein [Thermoanaerobaculia bacterium]